MMKKERCFSARKRSVLVDAAVILLVLGAASWTVRSVVIRPLVILQEEDMSLKQTLDQVASQVTSSSNVTLPVSVEPQYVLLQHQQSGQTARDTVCQASAGSTWSAVVDLSWQGVDLRPTSASLPHVRVQVTNQPVIQLTMDYLHFLNATDAVLILNERKDIQQAAAVLLGASLVRLVLMQGGRTAANMSALANIRPSPAYYVVLGDSFTAQQVVWQAMSEGLVTSGDTWWTIVLTNGADGASFNRAVFQTAFTLASPDRNTHTPEMVADNAYRAILESFVLMAQENSNEANVKLALSCEVPAPTTSATAAKTGMTSGLTQTEFFSKLQAIVNRNDDLLINPDDTSSGATQTAVTIMPAVSYTLQQTTSAAQMTPLGQWTSQRRLQIVDNYAAVKIRRRLRVGVIQSNPWTFVRRDDTGAPMIDNSGSPLYTGYCIDLLKELAVRMDFEFELVFPADGAFGIKDPQTGQWNGLVGELSRQETDMIVAPLSMTSEREEVIDFVAPYFDQSGISIMIRERENDASLFRFMSVMRLEVWLCVVAALVCTGLLIWLLDRLSPYSAQNNPHKYAQHGYRKFTIKESFWFALTSFTPQGGGEAPRALSGRTLVAAYWLFAVLMLATFTANLAAFLTVERLQTSVKSLDELAKQSRVVYSVVANSAVQSYFDNMAYAEEALFKVWKNMTLSASIDQARYRVWEYPIKEQFTHVLNVIRGAGMAANESVGLQRVLDNTQGTLAFIHDASIVRYEVYQNCNLTQIGQPFAEQPYAIAVQRGSRLRQEISSTILSLQRDRFFEGLTATYWNSTYRSLCPSRGDSEGITLQSLGGVFIATLVGLAMALVTLIFEVVYYRRESQVAPSNATTDASDDGVTSTRVMGISTVEQEQYR